MNESIPLHSLEAGRTAAVTAIVGQNDTVHRLKEIGLHEGAEVEMIQSGTPCIVRLDGQRLCLRGDALLRVLVRPGVAV